MKLASFKVRGRESFGAVVGQGASEGVVDLKTRLAPQFESVLDLLRDGGLDTARAVVQGVRADFPLRELEFLPPVLQPEKILCIGINYANRNADYGEAETPQYPSMFYRAPGSLVGHLQPLVRPRESEQLDYEGEIALVIGRAGRRIAREHALDYVAGATLCNEGTIRDWTRHGKFNVTQGKNWDCKRQHRPLDRDRRRDRLGEAAAHRDAAQRRSDAGRHHRQHDQVVHRHPGLCQHVHDAETGRHHRHRHAG